MTAEPANPLEARIARLEGSYERIDRRLGRSRPESTAVSPTCAPKSGLPGAKRTEKLDRLDARIDKLDTKIDSRFNIVTFLGFFIAAVQIATALGLFDRLLP